MTSTFALPAHPTAKADPLLIAADEQHFTAIAAAVEEQVGDLTSRLQSLRQTPTRAGQEVFERDLQVHRNTARLRVLRRFGMDVCLGRMVPADGTPPVYIGRVGLSDHTAEPLLVDWRAPAAELFFAATHADPAGLTSRRRYRWNTGRVVGYWDEVFTPDGMTGHAALDDQSAFLASLATTRTSRMRDVLGTIQSDQDAAIRASSRGALVVDGGPGTGKTVVALHRAAYLLYSDPRLGAGRGGVLFVGPHQPYLAYVGDVLPSLGEEGVQTCTVRDLVPEGATAAQEPDPAVAALKAAALMATAIEPAVRLYEEPPTSTLSVDTPWGEIRIGPVEWAAAFDAPGTGIPHNDAQDQVWDELVTIAADQLEQHDEETDADRDLLERSMRQDDELDLEMRRSWPTLQATDIVGDLFTVPAYLRRCAPWLTTDQVRLLHRPDPHAWTISDLPLLDAARDRLGDPHLAQTRRERAAALAVGRAAMDDVVGHLIATDDSEMQVMSMLRGEDLRSTLDDAAGAPPGDPDLLRGPFAHIVVDEAQELTAAEWQMLLRRCPAHSLTVVGDRAQARHGFGETWPERLAQIGLEQVTVASLSVNYRTPIEVMTAAEPVIRAALPDANVPTSVRSTGIPVQHGPVSELASVIDTWLRDNPDGVACVIGDDSYPARARVQSLTPQLCRGLEFDLVVLIDPDQFGTRIEGTVDRYVAMTRATHHLVILDPAR
ncbi:MAG: RNA polymerase recycling motor ATPase HelR [Phycicoccus sp.]